MIIDLSIMFINILIILSFVLKMHHKVPYEYRDLYYCTLFMINITCLSITIIRMSM